MTATANTAGWDKYGTAAWAGWKVGRCGGSDLTAKQVHTMAANASYDTANPKPAVTAKNNKTGGKAYVNGIKQ